MGSNVHYLTRCVAANFGWRCRRISWGCPSGLFGVLLGPLVGFWVVFNVAFVGAVGALLAAFGPLLGHYWPLLWRRTWPLLGRAWPLSGRLSDPPPLGRAWGHLGTNQSQDRNPDRPLPVVVVFLAGLGAQSGAQNGLKTIPKRVQNQDEQCITFLSLSNPSWGGLEAILGLSWDKKAPTN